MNRAIDMKYVQSSGTRALGFVVAAILLAADAGLAGDRDMKVLDDFSDASTGGRWTTVNDDVMGGVSTGEITVRGDGTLIFSGKLSLENRGGFTSIRMRPGNLDLAEYDTVALRVKGDGRSYSFNLRTDATRMATSYRAPFDTRAGTWQDIRLPLAAFTYTRFGQPIPQKGSVAAGDITGIGVTLSDKKAGFFKLEIDWIRMEKAASPSGQPDGAMGDIVATAVKAGQFNTLVAAVKAAGLVEALQADGPVTVFAPNDAAFAKLPDGAVAELLKPENRDRLTAVLTYHVVPGTIRIGETAPKTLQGSPLSIESRGVKVNGATVIASDIEASNGLIQIIDTVLMPPETRQTPPEAAEGVITLAISRGVPLFNAGQEAACAAIYEVALDSLLQVHTGALDDRQRTRIQQALQKVRQDGNHDAANAWTLRYALDDISRSLEGR